MSNQVQKIDTLGLLSNFSTSRLTGQLIVFDGSVDWRIYFTRGQIIFASHSVDPFERLGRHLSHLGHKNFPGFNKTRAQLNTGRSTKEGNEYPLICQWFNSQLLSKLEITSLIERLVKEVLCSLLVIKAGNYQLTDRLDSLPTFCSFQLQPILDSCQKQVRNWQLLGPEIVSPYQRPCLLESAKTQPQLLRGLPSDLVARLNGFSSLYHLAATRNQEELQLAKELQPYILNRIIGLHKPHPPFDKLPNFFLPPSYGAVYNFFPKNDLLNNTSPRLTGKQRELTAVSASETTTIDPTISGMDTKKILTTPTQIQKSAYKIAVVDDSRSMLKLISSYLDESSFSVCLINDPVKALMQILRVKPDLILLDITMSGIDGYELCRLARNHPHFQKAPIIMVTGNRGIIDRAKAKLVGASGYLTKPFGRPDLLKIVFKHLR